eukprot:353021-Chlamydomonas_euryale.AAC.2
MTPLDARAGQGPRAATPPQPPLRGILKVVDLVGLVPVAVGSHADVEESLEAGLSQFVESDMGPVWCAFRARAMHSHGRRRMWRLQTSMLDPSVDLAAWEADLRRGAGGVVLTCPWGKVFACLPQARLVYLKRVGVEWPLANIACQPAGRVRADPAVGRRCRRRRGG